MRNGYNLETEDLTVATKLGFNVWGYSNLGLMFKGD